MDCTLCNGTGRIVFVEFDTRAVLPCPVCGEAAAEARRYRLAREQMAREFGSDRQRREIAAERKRKATRL